MLDELEENRTEKPNWSKHWQTLCRRRWWLVLPAFGVWAVVWAAGWFLPAVYRSEIVILVEQQKVPEQYVVSNDSADLQERLQSMTQQILSRTRLLRIMDEFGLYAKQRDGFSADELVERMRKDIQIELVEAPNRRGDLTAFKIAYSARDPRIAQQVANQLSSLFIVENLKVRQQQAEDTTDFLDSQLKEAGQNLSDQEQKVKDFKSHYLGELPGQVQGNVQILSGLQSRLQQEMEALGHAKQQGVYYESLLGQWRSFQADLQVGRSTSTQSPPALDQELDRLRAQLADLSAHYTERHPDVRKLKDQIAKTEKMKQQMEAQLEAARAGVAATGPDGAHPSSYADLQALSPMMDLDSQLKANRLEVQDRQRSIQALEKQIDEYQARLNTTPLREQQLADITRDYDQSRKNYELLLGKRDQSEMATNLQKRQQGEQFRVLDPADLPEKPYSPNRLKLSLIGLFAGIVIGGFSMAAAEFTDDRVYAKEDLIGVVDAMVLTEIPPLPTAEEQDRELRKKWLQWTAMTIMLVATLTGFGVSYYLG
jgi:polysaccharide biosynthesis transport protein